MNRPYFLSICVFSIAASWSSAHVNIVLPATPSNKKGDEVVFAYQWGHPYEHEIFDAPKPQRINVLFPDGETHKDLTATLEAFKQVGAEDKPITSWKFRFTPQQRGDHTFFLETPPIWLEADKEFVQDIVRVTLHVQTQNGWDNDVGAGFRLAAVTRPYGLLPHMVFQAQVLRDRDDKQPVIWPHIEIERYNPASPKQLPADELITFRTRFDANGVFTFAFPEAGWWSFTAQRDGGMREHKGNSYPVRQRLTMWVHVEDRK